MQSQDVGIDKIWWKQARFILTEKYDEVVKNLRNVLNTFALNTLEKLYVIETLFWQQLKGCRTKKVSNDLSNLECL